MGQYFILVNLDKGEYIKVLGALKLWEWCANNHARLAVWLLAKGPQDGTTLLIHDPKFREAEEVFFNSKDEVEKMRAFEIINEEASKPIGQGYFKTCGRWAGDRVVLIGDYDESGLYHRALRKFKDITEEVVREFNEFIEREDLKV